MVSSEKIIQVIFEAIDELNEQLPKEERLEKSLNKVQFGSGGNIDSLRLVSLMTTLEQKIEEQFGITIAIFDHLASSENDNLFNTVASLADFLVSTMENR
ncbi:MAG: hypothetical protein AB1499_00900 [Nitrospirota bacterium]